MFTEPDMVQARRQLVQAAAVLTFRLSMMPNQAARNVLFHAEELMRSLDDLYAGRVPEDREPPSDDELRDLLDGLT